MYIVPIYSYDFFFDLGRATKMDKNRVTNKTHFQTKLKKKPTPIPVIPTDFVLLILFALS